MEAIHSDAMICGEIGRRGMVGEVAGVDSGGESVESGSVVVDERYL